MKKALTVPRTVLNTSARLPATLTVALAVVAVGIPTIVLTDMTLIAFDWVGEWVGVVLLVLVISAVLYAAGLGLVIQFRDVRNKRLGPPSWASGVGIDKSTPQQFPFEARLCVIATRVVTEIQNSRAWQSDWLDTHRIRMNPREELAQIVQRASELHEVRRDLGAAPDAYAGGGHLLVVHQRHLADLATVAKTLVDRVVALKAYQDDLGRFTLLLEAKDSLDRAESLSGRIAELVGRSVQDEMASESLNRLNQEMRDVADGLRATLALLA